MASDGITDSQRGYHYYMFRNQPVSQSKACECGHSDTQHNGNGCCESGCDCPQTVKEIQAYHRGYDIGRLNK